jgi:hypothetical protein
MAAVKSRTEIPRLTGLGTRTSRSALPNCRAAAQGHDFFSRVVFGHYPVPLGGTEKVSELTTNVNYKN